MAFASLTIEDSEIDDDDREFLNEWANRLGVTITELLKRILIAAVNGDHYIENMPD
jgi:hypothetical protein